MAALTNELELQGRNFNSQRTCVPNSMVLMSIHLKMLALKVSEFAPFCTHKYVNEEEEKEEKENMTILTKYHGKVLTTYFIIMV